MVLNAKTASFQFFEVRKGILVPQGAETHEVVASDPRIDGIRAFLVVFGRFFGVFVVDLAIDRVFE